MGDLSIGKMKKVGKSISVLIVPDFSVTVLVSPLKEKCLV